MTHQTSFCADGALHLWPSVPRTAYMTEKNLSPTGKLTKSQEVKGLQLPLIHIKEGHALLWLFAAAVLQSLSSQWFTGRRFWYCSCNRDITRAACCVVTGLQLSVNYMMESQELLLLVMKIWHITRTTFDPGASSDTPGRICFLRDQQIRLVWILGHVWSETSQTLAFVEEQLPLTDWCQIVSGVTVLSAYKTSRKL